jgi:hypothetical protein
VPWENDREVVRQWARRRRKGELEDEGGEHLAGGDRWKQEKREKGWARMALSGRRTTEGGGYWIWDNVGSTEGHNSVPPPFVKGRMARGVRNPSLTVDLSAPIQAVERCVANSGPPP